MKVKTIAETLICPIQQVSNDILTPTQKSATITSLGGVSLLTVPLMGYCTISSLYNNQKSIMMFCPLNGH